jgi:hypothetical protein
MLAMGNEWSCRQYIIPSGEHGLPYTPVARRVRSWKKLFVGVRRLTANIFGLIVVGTPSLTILFRAKPLNLLSKSRPGGCPHSAIREDTSMNLAAFENLSRKFPQLDLILVESGGERVKSAVGFSCLVQSKDISKIYARPVWNASLFFDLPKWPE